jgi:hypothetical protein
LRFIIRKYSDETQNFASVLIALPAQFAFFSFTNAGTSYKLTPKEGNDPFFII